MMCRVIGLFVFMFISTGTIQGQYIRDVHIDNIKSDIIEVRTRSKSLSSQGYAIISYGQELTYNYKDDKIVDKNGEPILFNSRIHLLNYMKNYNYEYMDNFVDVKDGYSYIVFLLKRMENE